MLIKMLGKYTVPLQCQIWHSYLVTGSSFSPYLVKESLWRRWRHFEKQSWKKLCQNISWRNNLIACPRKLLLTTSSHLIPWGTSWTWACWEGGAPQLRLWPSTGAHLEVPGGMLRLGLLQEAETVGNRNPFPEEKAVSSSNLGLWWLGPAITSW